MKVILMPVLQMEPSFVKLHWYVPSKHSIIGPTSVRRRGHRQVIGIGTPMTCRFQTFFNLCNFNA
jgi:hypothetical protein